MGDFSVCAYCRRHDWGFVLFQEGEMKHYQKVIIFVFFLTVCIVVATISIGRLTGAIGESERLKIVREEAKIQRIWFWATFWEAGSVTLGTILLLSCIIFSYGFARYKVVQGSVFMAQIGESQIPVSHRQIKKGSLAPALMTLASAEEIRAHFPEEAFDLYRLVGETSARQLRAMTGNKGFLPMQQAPYLAIPEQTSSNHVPTFAELYVSGQINHESPMILGFENGIPKQGSFLDIYSSAIAGDSGSGKTSTMLYFIGCGLLCEQAWFLGIDPHYPHPQSLGKKIEPLWKAGLMKFAHMKYDIIEMCEQVETLIETRMNEAKEYYTPAVIVIDELHFLCKTSMKNAIVHMMERISTEGRKVQVYMLASSQTWLAAIFGNSVTRDTLTSAYVHRIKPRQANYLLQDKEESDKVKKYIKRAGQALLCPVSGESSIVDIPFTTAEDMQKLSKKIVNGPDIELPRQDQYERKGPQRNNVVIFPEA